MKSCIRLWDFGPLRSPILNFMVNMAGSKSRDLAYHQGTVWVFPLGAYYLAYLKTRNYSREAAEKVERQLEVLQSAMAEGCIGQLPEIYDGENPDFSKGCFAQAWSVGEILRVYEALEFIFSPHANKIPEIAPRKIKDCRKGMKL